jgi:excisionase family DNA binding protein
MNNLCLTQVAWRSTFPCMTQLPRYLTAEQVAERFEVTAEAARNWARTGKVKAIRLPGGQYRFPVEAIEAIEQQAAAGVTS